MKLPTLELEESVFIELAKKYHIREMALFGSVLRADFGPESDVDILVQFSDDMEYSLFDLFEIKAQFEKVLGRKVDLVEKRGLKNPYRSKEILSTARVIYAA